MRIKMKLLAAAGLALAFAASSANAKDSGDIFPGHGGMFDRLDSVFAALPVWATGLALLDL